MLTTDRIITEVIEQWILDIRYNGWTLEAQKKINIYEWNILTHFELRWIEVKSINNY